MTGIHFCSHLQVRFVFKFPSFCCLALVILSVQVLMYFGPEALKELVKNAELYPIKGLFEFSAFFREIDAYYHQSRGFELGISTGWRALDELYKVRIKIYKVLLLLKKVLSR